MHRPRHARPRGGLLGEHRDAGALRADEHVQLLQELDRLEVLAAAVLVRHPLPLLARVIEVQHRRHRVHPQAVDVELLDPVERVREQERSHLVPAVVEDQRAPVLMLALAGIGVLVGGGAVEPRQAMLVLREVARDPVEDHADVGLMTGVHERLEILGRTEAAGRREEANHLIAPRAGERMLHHRQQLDVGEAHLLHVGHELGGHLAIGEQPPLRRTAPAAQMHLVDRHRPLQPPVLRGARRHPRLVPPRVAVAVPDD